MWSIIGKPANVPSSKSANILPDNLSKSKLFPNFNKYFSTFPYYLISKKS